MNDVSKKFTMKMKIKKKFLIPLDFLKLTAEIFLESKYVHLVILAILIYWNYLIILPHGHTGDITNAVLKSLSPLNMALPGFAFVILALFPSFSDTFVVLLGQKRKNANGTYLENFLNQLIYILIWSIFNYIFIFIYSILDSSINSCNWLQLSLTSLRLLIFYISYLLIFEVLRSIYSLKQLIILNSKHCKKEAEKKEKEQSNIQN